MNALLNSIHIKNDVFSYKLYNTIAILAILIVVVFVLYWFITKKSFRQCYIVFLNNQVFTILLALAAIQVLYQVVHNVESILDFSVLTAFVATFLINIISSVVRDYFRNQDEDPTKLTTHYDDLIVKYYGSKDKFYKLKEKDSDGNPFQIPVIKDFEFAGFSTIYINDNTDKIYKISPADNRTESIYEYRDELFRAHDASNIYNQLNIRVDDWYIDDYKDLIICTSRTTFYASLMTNRVMDYKMKNGYSVRELLQPGPFVPELKKSALSNHLGVNAFIVSNDGYIPFVKRSSTVSIGKRTYGSSISASLKTKYALKSVEDRFNADGLKKAICGEIKDELNISSDYINEIEIIAAYRDVVEGNKPQLLVYVEVNKTNKEIKKAFKKNIKKKRKRKLSVGEIEEQDGKKLKWYKIDRFQKISVLPNKLLYKWLKFIKIKHPIVPSVGISIVETQEYIKEHKKNLLGNKDMANKNKHGKKGKRIKSNTGIAVKENEIVIKDKQEEVVSIEKPKMSFSEKIGIGDSIVSIICSLIGVGFAVVFFWKGIQTLDDYKEYIKFQDTSIDATQEWMEDISNIRIGSDSSYIQSLLGEPLFTKSIEFYDTKYIKTYYINSYCTIMCIYSEDLSLVGYAVIGNKNSMKIKNYRCGFTLFDYTINEAEEYCSDNYIGPEIYCSSNMNGRLDCNDYYFQCSFQHSHGATPNYYIGYGICDIGAIDSYDEFDYGIRNMKPYDAFGDNKEYYENSKKDSIRDLPINTMFVMREIDHMEEFMKKYVASSCLCLSVDDFANYQNDYESYINEYLERNRKYGEKYINTSTEE